MLQVLLVRLGEDKQGITVNLYKEAKYGLARIMVTKDGMHVLNVEGGYAV